MIRLRMPGGIDLGDPEGGECEPYRPTLHSVELIRPKG
jgi:hypothetical protein